jgi:hypothetical protein
MRLSRFVLTYENVRPGEHVLYDLVRDHCLGVDNATLDGIRRWAEAEPEHAEEREVHDALKEEGLLVQDKQEDDLRLRAFLEKVSEGIPGTMRVTLMPTLTCNLACT